MALAALVRAADISSYAGYWQLPVPPQGAAPPAYHPLTRDLSPAACGLCHQDKYKQWSTSIHAQAMSNGLAGQLGWTSEQNREACLGCHTPRSEEWAMWGAHGASAMDDIHGIDCAGCHVRHHQRFGPRDVADTPHGKVEGLALFKHSEFCMRCHQFPPGQGTILNGKPLENTYNEWRASRYSAAGQTCQSCHMPAGYHGFRGVHDPEMTRRGLKVKVTRTAEGFHVHAWNAGAGHALPTYATPRITIEAEAALHGRLEKASYIIQRRVSWDPRSGWHELSDTRLLPDQAVDLRLPLAKDQTVRVNVIVDPDQDYHNRVYPLLLAKQANLTAADRQMLEAARDHGIKNSYLLYRFECGPWKGGEASCGDGTVASGK
jgi:hypothetical protein